jgi:hypothetical protein
MVQKIYWGFEKRRMRLDRLLVSKVQQTHFKKPLEIYLTPTLIEIIGNASMATSDVKYPEYLFPSDHFGLSLKCTLSKL